MKDTPSLSINEAAKALRLGKTKLYALIRDGHLPARKLGSRTIVLSEDLERFLNSLPKARKGS